MSVADAHELAYRLLASDVPSRWLHSLGAAATAKRFAPILDDWETLVAAAYLHDIGYSSQIYDVGFHPIDGARHLRANGWPEAVVNLVANHSNAAVQARIGGFADDLEREFPLDPDLPHRQLRFCDLSVDIDGRPVSLGQRLAGIRYRHGHCAEMRQYLDESEPELHRMVDEIDRELSEPLRLTAIN